MKPNIDLTSNEFIVSMHTKQLIHQINKMFEDINFTFEYIESDRTAKAMEVVVTGLHNVRYDLIEVLKTVGE